METKKKKKKKKKKKLKQKKKNLRFLKPPSAAVITSDINDLYEEYDIDKVAYLFENFDLFSDKVYNKCQNNEDFKNETNKGKNWFTYIILNE
jgi:hypothetical protein